MRDRYTQSHVIVLYPLSWQSLGGDTEGGWKKQTTPTPRPHDSCGDGVQYFFLFFCVVCFSFHPLLFSCWWATHVPPWLRHWHWSKCDFCCNCEILKLCIGLVLRCPWCYLRDVVTQYYCVLSHEVELSWVYTTFCRCSKYSQRFSLKFGTWAVQTSRLFSHVLLMYSVQFRRIPADSKSNRFNLAAPTRSAICIH